MCRHGGTSMTGLEQRTSSAAPIKARAAISIRCWRACALAAILATSAQAATPSTNQGSGSESSAAATSSGGSDATSSHAARDEAVRAIPWKLMSPASRQTTQSILNNTSIYRRLPTRIIDCDTDLFTFLLQHPEVVIDVWRVMGISQVALSKMRDGSYRGTDGVGTTGTVRYMFGRWGVGTCGT